MDTLNKPPLSLQFSIVLKFKGETDNDQCLDCRCALCVFFNDNLNKSSDLFETFCTKFKLNYNKIF